MHNLTMGLLQERMSKYREPQKYINAGVYPYFREIDSHQDTEVMMSGKRVLMFGSNSYMGLTYDKRICEAAINAIKKYGTGCAGSRFLNGTLDLHIQLEKELADFVGKDEALVYSTGFTVNSGVVSCLTGRNDYIIGDDRDHASIVDGRRLSFSQFFHYKHNDMEDLEHQLMRCNADALKLIVIDGLFSMEGDLAKLPEIIELKKKYNATVMVDEAHGLGVFGKQGRGVCITSLVHPTLLLPQQLLSRLFTFSRLSLSARRISGRPPTTPLSNSSKLVSRLAIQKVLSFHFMCAMPSRLSKSPSWLSTKACLSTQSFHQHALHKTHSSVWH